jgi:hypothetical protein
MKVADIYADFTVEVDRGIDSAVRKIKSQSGKFEQAGDQAGSAFGHGFERRIGSKLVQSIAKKSNDWAKIGRAGGENYARGFDNGANIRSTMSGLAATAKSASPGFRVAGKSAGGEYSKGFSDSSALKVGAVGGAEAAGEKMGEQLGRGFDRGASRSVDKATEKVASRTQAKFKALQFAGAFAGLPIAAGVAAVATSGILAGAGAGFIALAAVALASNRDIQDSYNALWEHVQAGTRDAAAPLKDEFVQAANDIGAGFSKLQPQIAQAMSASQPYVEDLVDSVLGFADNAMPGAVRAVERAQPVFNALQVASEDLGTGVTELLDGLSTHSVAAGKGLQQFGNMGRDAIAFVGQFVGNLAEGAAPALVTFDGALEKAYQTGITLSTTGLPTLTSAVQGFTQPIQGGLSILNGFASALGSWSEPLGNAAGQLWSTNMIMGLMGTSIGSTVGGFKNLAAGVDEGGKKVGTFGEQVGKAEGKIGKVKAGFNALTNAGVNPLAMALGAVTLAMGLFGQAAEEAEQKQARFDQGVRNLRSTLDETTGAITAKTKATIADLAQNEKVGVSQKKVADLSKEYGFSLQELSHIVTTGGAAMDAFGSKMQGSAGAALNASLSQSEWNTLAEAGISQSDLLTLSLGQSAAGYASLDDLVQKTSGSTDEYTQRLAAAAHTAAAATQGQRDFATWVREQNSQLAKAQEQLRATTDAASGMGGAFKLSAAASQQMGQALAQVGSDATSAKEQAQALMWILDKLSGSNITLSDAQSKSGEAIRQANEQIKAFKGSAASTVADLVNASGGINGLTEAGAKLNGVFSNLAGTSLQEASAAFMEVQARGGSVAEQMSAIAGPVERARAKFIEAADAAGLNAQQAAQLANEMGLIPEIVQIQILAKGSQEVSQKLLDIRGQLQNIPTGTVNVDASKVAGVESQLAALGYKLTALPNGQVRVTAPGANQVQQQISSIADQVNTMPAGKTLRIAAPTAEVQSALSLLGYTITNLPDGQVEITADPRAAMNEANALAENIAGRPIIAPMDLNTGGGGSTYGAFKMGIESVPVIAQLTANAAAAYAATGGWQGAANAAVGTGTLGANATPAHGALTAWWSKSNATKATGTLAANNDAAMQALATWSAYVKASKPVGTIGANIGPAVSAWNSWQPAGKMATVYVAKVGPGAALKDGGTVPAFANGGTVGQRFNSSGTVRGEGGPRQDKVIVAVSPLEEVTDARNAGRNRPLLKMIGSGADKLQVAATALREAGLGMPVQQPSNKQVHVQVDVHGYTGSADELLSRLEAEMVYTMEGMLD